MQLEELGVHTPLRSSQQQQAARRRPRADAHPVRAARLQSLLSCLPGLTCLRRSGSSREPPMTARGSWSTGTLLPSPPLLRQAEAQLCAAGRNGSRLLAAREPKLWCEPLSAVSARSGPTANLAPLFHLCRQKLQARIKELEKAKKEFVEEERRKQDAAAKEGTKEAKV